MKGLRRVPGGSMCWTGTLPDEGAQNNTRRAVCRFSTGDTGDVYEFVCDHLVTPQQVADFDRIAKECQYERKYRKPHTTPQRVASTMAKATWADHSFRRLAVPSSSSNPKRNTPSLLLAPFTARRSTVGRALEQFEFQDEHRQPHSLFFPMLARSIDSSDGLFEPQSSHTPPKAANMSAKREHPPDILQYGALVLLTLLLELTAATDVRTGSRLSSTLTPDFSAGGESSRDTTISSVRNLGVSKSYQCEFWTTVFWSDVFIHRLVDLMADVLKNVER
ncbi:vacuolar import and degradation protein [Colletotrichum plurivorum]|uniref:Vacuolar import and degradation protein n=1 Tax=Colletotrichum plurivorum TaxID=2175906 RepID=A0A8H6J575_9PEZI|nr:vacuolar import and degradation protein [Colletotrichum plurivorum]